MFTSALVKRTLDSTGGTSRSQAGRRLTRATDEAADDGHAPASGERGRLLRDVGRHVAEDFEDIPFHRGNRHAVAVDDAVTRRRANVIAGCDDPGEIERVS